MSEWAKCAWHNKFGLSAEFLKEFFLQIITTKQVETIFWYFEIFCSIPVKDIQFFRWTDLEYSDSYRF